MRKLLLVLATLALALVPLSLGGHASAASTPFPPAGLSSTVGDSTITLAWGHPFNDGGSPITSYNVYRGNAHGTETLLASVAPNTPFTTFADTVPNCTTFYYWITSVNAFGESWRHGPELWTEAVPAAGC